MLTSGDLVSDLKLALWRDIEVTAVDRNRTNVVLGGGLAGR